MGDVIRVDFGSDGPSGDEMRITLDVSERTVSLEFARPVKKFVLGEKEAEGVLTALVGMMFKLKEGE
mgnify:CR=1 FL=1